MGSVKDLIVGTKPTEFKLGEGLLYFSDRYSVFDWGEMPDHIPNKGAALCVMAAWNFERLEEQGIPTHYRGVLDDSLLSKTTNLIKPANNMAIYLSRIIKPRFIDGIYDYSYFIENRGKLNNFVIPLENIYRRGAPKGSSLLKTIFQLEKEGNITALQNLLTKYGLTEKPKPGDLFPKTGYDFTTKFEEGDRKLTDEEALDISGLTREQFEQLKSIRNSVVSFISKRAERVGMIDYDGKHEYLFFNEEVKLADVAGTFDENRFMFNGEQVSKEFLRQYYKAHQLEWCEDIERAKAEAREKGINEWKNLMKTKPKPLPPRLVELVGEMYAAGADRYTSLNLFNVRPLEQVMDDLRPFYPK